MDSNQCGVLEAGETISVADRRINEANIYRCKFVTSKGLVAWCGSFRCSALPALHDPHDM
jgi:hypothetical protein